MGDVSVDGVVEDGIEGGGVAGAPAGDVPPAEKKSHKKLIALVVAAVIVVAGCVTEGVLVHDYAMDRLAACQRDEQSLSAVRDAYTQAVGADDTVAALKITSDQVVEPSTVADLASAVSFSLPSPQACDGDVPNGQVVSLDALAKDDAAKYTTQTAALTADVQAVNDSKSAKDAADALATLQKEIKTAQALVKSSSGKVASGDKTRSSLSTELTAAQKVSADTTKTAADFTAETTKLKTAEKKVSSAVSAKTKADQQAAAAAAAVTSKVSSNGPYSYGSSASHSSSSGTGSGCGIDPGTGAPLCGPGSAKEPIVSGPTSCPAGQEQGWEAGVGGNPAKFWFKYVCRDKDPDIVYSCWEGITQIIFRASNGWDLASAQASAAKSGCR